MSLGTKLAWRIRPRLHIASPGLARRPSTLPHSRLPEVLLLSPCLTRPHSGSVRYASKSTNIRSNADHDTKPTPTIPFIGLPKFLNVPRDGENGETTPDTRFDADHDTKSTSPIPFIGLSNFLKAPRAGENGENGETTPALLQFERLLRDKSDSAVADKEGNTDISTTRVRVPTDSVMDKPVNRYPQHRETMSSYSRYLRKKDGKQRVEERQAAHGRTPDWRVVLSMLQRNTRPTTWNTPHNARVIWVAEGVVDSLLHDPDHTIWDIGLRTDCVLELSTDKVEADAAGRRLVRLRLSGSDEAMDAAKAEIFALSFSHPLSSNSGKQADRSTSTTLITAEKTQWASNRRNERPSNIHPYACFTRYEDIPRPEQWTTRSLEAYIMKIIRAKFPPHVMSKLYGSGVDGRMAAVGLMQRVLASEETANALSVRAFKLAIQFAADIGPGCRPQVRALISTAMAARLTLDTPIFNILLIANAHIHDLESFADVLRIMMKRGLAPNFITWTYFLSIIEDLKVKMHVCRAMDGRGLLRGLHGRRALAYEFIYYELEQERGRWQGLESFLDRQNKKFGPGWITQATANRVIDELGRQGKLKSCIKFFDRISLEGLVDTTTLNVLLNHANQHRSSTFAIVALQRAQVAGISLNKDSYHELFKTFRTMRRANCMSIIWRVACLRGRTTFGMRKSITDLYNNFPALLATDSSLPVATESSLAVAIDSSLPVPALRRNSRPEAQYEIWRDIPTFHHPSMEPRLLKVLEARKAEASQSNKEVEYSEDTSAAIGPLIATLFRQSWPPAKWRAQRPLYALLADADHADRELGRSGKDRRERAQHEAIAAGSTDGLSEVATNSDRFASPGMPFLIHTKNDDPRVYTVVDMKSTIYSRTYGVTKVERDVSDPDGVTEAETVISGPGGVTEVEVDAPGPVDAPEKS